MLFALRGKLYFVFFGLRQCQMYVWLTFPKIHLRCCDIAMAEKGIPMEPIIISTKDKLSVKTVVTDLSCLNRTIRYI